MNMRFYQLVSVVAALAQAAFAQPGPPDEGPPGGPPDDFPPGQSDSTPAQREANASTAATNELAPTPAGPAIVPTTGSLENTARLNFRDAPIATVLNYLSATYGFVITGQTEIKVNVNIIANTPISANDAVKMLNGELVANGYQAVQVGKKLKIMTVSDAKKSAGTPVIGGANFDPTNIPMDDIVVTQILPVHSLAPTQLAKDLQPLFPDRDTLTPNEAGNALIMTAPQSDIHRLAEMVKDLDSTSVSDVRVFPLQYGDATSLASELRDIFTDPNAQQNNIRNFIRARFGGGPFGGGGGGGDAGPATPAFHVNAVADDLNNAVLVSAPAEYMENISNLISQLDRQSEDVTQVQVFHLKHADPTDTANELTTLFPDETQNSSQGNRFMGFRFAGPGGPGGFRPGGGAQQSDRMKRKSRVMAVADPRTGCVIVTAAKDLMEQIGLMITNLDQIDARQQRVASFAIRYADPVEVQSMMQDLFQGANARPSSSSTQQSPLQQRQTQLQQQNNTSTSSFGTGGGGTPALH